MGHHGEHARGFRRPSRGAVIALVLAAPAACSPGAKARPDPPLTKADTLTIGAGQEHRVAGTPLVLRFARVREDSRCPENVTCVWSGNAEVELEARVGSGSPVALLLNTDKGDRTRTVDRYAVELIALRPRPKAGNAIPPDGYEADLIVGPAP